MRPAIRVDKLAKQYRIGTRRRSAQGDLRETITEGVKAIWRRLRGAAQAPSAETDSEESGDFWALKDVSFEVQPGEVVGVIGRNGAGKSTLLKILSRITEPTSGRAEVRGRMSSLLEVGTGFHPDLSGRENIYLNGSILGMSRKEISSKFDEIVAFSEIEKFIDTPVKRYSSGMYVRLAFAVAAHLEPDILLLDEVLAVGDTAFQNKCLGKMSEVSRAGRTVIFVSHNMHAVNILCPKAILLRNGQLYRTGPSSDVIRHYLEAKTDLTAEASWEGDARPGNDLARVNAVRVLSAHDSAKFDHDISEPIHLAMDVAVLKPGACVEVSFHLINKEGLCLFAVGATLTPDQPGQATPPGVYQAICKIPANFLNDGKHYVSAFLVRNKSDIFVIEREVVSFMAHDYGTGRGGYMGTFIGAIRPHLPWTVERLGDLR
jgi:lipopolysaccharide transport system ATP-binding protein